MEATKTSVGRNKLSRVSLIWGIVEVITFLCSISIEKLFGFNGMNTASVLLSCFSVLLFFIAGVVAILAGIISLVQIEKSGEEGKRSAIVGILLGVLPFLLALMIVVWG